MHPVARGVRVGVNCHPAAGFDGPQPPKGHALHNLNALEREVIISNIIRSPGPRPENFCSRANRRFFLSLRLASKKNGLPH
jgi:hypothetical protein